ncbi:glutathione S-transfersae-related protein [Vibrio ishigakensis]|uniref:Glutathione S-transfersae-related protein n=1 Tax=Vibrio ishigakensis TaxID=1481914 RepID=A0A0B8NVD6_9VIBR|nr:MAPEG family protein [Vibrio ishigakensis]GAM56262.1 glutathione S-transfersae-related protein [Vibrio ishigakensis]
MATSLYASLLAAWVLYLAFQVIKQRRKHRISHADGEVEDLKVARGAHSNATEYIPIALILLFLAEYNGLYTPLVHLLGLSLVVGRVMHGLSILNKKFKGRYWGMILTLIPICSLAVINIGLSQF